MIHKKTNNEILFCDKALNNLILSNKETNEFFLTEQNINKQKDEKMAKKETITIVTLIENDPILGAKYGEQEITLEELDRQKHIDRYLAAKARNKEIIHKNRTMQK